MSRHATNHRHADTHRRGGGASIAGVDISKNETLVYGYRAVAAGIATARTKRILHDPATRHAQTRQLIATLTNDGGDNRRHAPPQQACSRAALTRLCGSDRHQDIAAVITIVQTTLSALVTSPSPLLVLDGVTDARNFGALLRTARAFGVAGVIVPTRHSAPLNAGAAKAAAGALAFVPVLRVVNIARTITAIKEAEPNGRMVVGLCEDGDADVHTAAQSLPPNVCWVAGDEGRGLRANTRRHCDALLRINTCGGDGGCLNVGVAVGIALAAGWQNTSK